MMSLTKKANMHPLRGVSLEERIKIRGRIMAKYHNTVPVILCGGKDVVLSKTKFVIPVHATFGKLILHAREQILELKPSEAIFLFVGDDVSPPVSEFIEAVYERYKDPADGFLYVYVTKENTFG